MLLAFQKFVGNIPIERLDNSFIILRASEFLRKKNFSISSHKQLLGALKLYYNEIFQRAVDFSMIYPTRSERFLPQILSKEEVVCLFKSTSNLKHLTILKTIYALGLRRSEIINLKISDIDGKRKLVHIKN